MGCVSRLQRRAIDADDLELALHYKNATTVLLQRAELLADAREHTCDSERFGVRTQQGWCVQAVAGRVQGWRPPQRCSSGASARAACNANGPTNNQHERGLGLV